MYEYTWDDSHTLLFSRSSSTTTPFTQTTPNSLYVLLISSLQVSSTMVLVVVQRCRVFSSYLHRIYPQLVPSCLQRLLQRVGDLLVLIVAVGEKDGQRLRFVAQETVAARAERRELTMEGDGRETGGGEGRQGRGRHEQEGREGPGRVVGEQ